MSDYKPMTPDRIFEIIESQGQFQVHRYSYRDEQKRRVASRLVRHGQLKYEAWDQFVIYRKAKP